MKDEKQDNDEVLPPPVLSAVERRLLNLVGRAVDVTRTELLEAGLSPAAVKEWQETKKFGRVGPGHIGVADERHNIPQCKMKQFREVYVQRDGAMIIEESIDTQINTFFEANPNLLLVRLDGFGNGQVLLTYGSLVGENEMREHEDIFKDVEAAKTKRREEQELRELKAQQDALAKEEAADAARKKQRQDLEAQALKGRNCEKNHKHLIEERRKR